METAWRNPAGHCLAVEKMFDMKACDSFLLLRKRGAGSSCGM
jgi:hypothetical protein